MAEDAMEPVLKAFSIGFLLRSVFAGIFFVISLYIAIKGFSIPAKIEDGSAILGVVIPVALCSGVTAYGIHRSVVYPWFEWWFDSMRAKRYRKKMPLISKRTIDTLFVRWNQGESGSKFDCERINEQLNTWADHIHLQFTSALCIALGGIVGTQIDTGKHRYSCTLILLMFGFVVAAFASNWRHHSVLDAVKEKLKPEI